MTTVTGPDAGPGTGPLASVRRLYGEHPAHFVVLVLSFIPAALAFTQLLDERPFAVGKWFLGGAILHDGLLLPLYVLLDAAVLTLWRRRPGRVAWLNFVRFPLAVSGMLLLIFSPLILRQAESYQYKTGRSLDGFAGRWLLVTAILAAVSALWYLARVVWVRRHTPR
ncbi:hypothetical protein [Sporichthya sp.]|uniref:hypothetical protein n=1 Tax=Sporichthya sp. TaxID=65475 RepID=UPI00181D5E69|nr:hypothetical protein [Sporichthya sp.]MBA3742120.1 hypothetical protein [Sporichthya sp.]